MPRTPKKTLLALAAVALAAGCAHAPAPAGTPAARRGPPARDFFPLAVGNEWVWEDQSPQLPTERRGALRTIRITDKTADGFFRDNERGELKAAHDCIQDRQRQLLCGPIAAGTTWRSVLSVSSTEKYEITAVGETVTVPAGTFHGCVRVRAVNPGPPGTELIAEITYAPGVGPIRLETLALVKGAAQPQLKAVLHSYRLGGK